MASLTFGMGIGVGSAYEECAKEVLLDSPPTA